MDWGRALSRAGEDPVRAIRTLVALARGSYYRWKYRLLRRRVRIGRRFKVFGRLDIRGPGTVIFGDDCTIASTRIAPTTPYTHSRHAVLKFGNEVMLSGTRIGCQERIEVADRAGISEARVMDTDFHRTDLSGTPRSKTHARGRPIYISANAWVGAGAIVLKGVTIGENAVVGAGAVVAHDVPADTVVFGNPARVVSWISGAGTSRSINPDGKGVTPMDHTGHARAHADDTPEGFSLALRRFIEGKLGAPIDDDVPLLDQGLDSMGLLELISFIEESIEAAIPDEELKRENFRNVGTIEAMVHRLKVEDAGGVVGRG